MEMDKMYEIDDDADDAKQIGLLDESEDDNFQHLEIKTNRDQVVSEALMQELKAKEDEMKRKEEEFEKLQRKRAEEEQRAALILKEKQE